MSKCSLMKSIWYTHKHISFKNLFVNPPKPGQWTQNKIKLLPRKWTVPQLQIGSRCCCFTPIYTLFRQLFQVMALSSMEFNKVTGFPPSMFIFYNPSYSGRPLSSQTTFNFIGITASRKHAERLHKRVCSKFSLLIGSFFIRYLFREAKP